MSANVLGIEGEFRQFTPSEVGFVIKVCRNSMGLKREPLALSAKVSVKTIERAEAGVRLRERSSRRIAVALGLAADEFTKQRFIQHSTSPEESQRIEQRLNEAWGLTHVAVTVHEIGGVRDVLPLFYSDAVWCDDRNVADEHRQHFAALEQAMLAADDRMAEEVLARVRDLEASGYVVKGSVIADYIAGRPLHPGPSRWSCSYVPVFQKLRGLKDTTPVEGWVSKMRLLKLAGVFDANQFPGDENTVWTGRDALGILCGDADQ